MNDDHTNGKPTGGSLRPTKTKRAKPEYAGFIAELSQTLRSTQGTKAAETIYKIIRKGYTGESTEAHIDEIGTKLIDWERLEYLALKLGTDLSLGKPSLMGGRLYPVLQGSLAARCGYPTQQVPIEARMWDRAQKEAVQDWIGEHTTSGSVSPDWARDALVCLLKENTNDIELETIHSIIDRCVPGKKIRNQPVGTRKAKPPRRNKHGKYIRCVSRLFLARKFSPGKLQYGLDFSSVFIDNYESLERDFTLLSRDLDVKKAELSQLQVSLDTAETQMSELGTEVVRLREAFQKTGIELAKEGERYELLDNHWRERLKSELTSLAHKIKKRFGHEVQETRLSLQSNPPDIGMALNRVEHMEEYLRELGERNG